ncbi:MAG TPA: TIGR00730 family Rossman fold protein [Aquabacterium sp.]|nr:TIGR00730 family Rossman fold protein [Aquabacterium sp.]
MTEHATRPFSLCVYCGSRTGTDPAHLEAATQLGTAIGLRGWRLIYGGGRVGLMGAVADAALAAGGTVIGVIPESLMRLEVGHRGLTELLVVRTMHERKQAMAERADAFVALPGGIGTFEELFEVWTWRHLGYHQNPIGLLDINGYYEPLMSFLGRAVAEGFVNDTQMSMIMRHADAATLLDELHGAAQAALRSADLDRV